VIATTIDGRETGVGAFVASLLGLIGLLIALPIVLLAGAPFWGWLLGVGLWIVNWSVQLFTGRLSLRISAPAAVGVSGISFMARAWLVAILLFVVALRFSQEAALAAAGVFLAAFTFDLAGRAILFGLTQQQTPEESAAVAAEANAAAGDIPAPWTEELATQAHPAGPDRPSE